METSKFYVFEPFEADLARDFVIWVHEHRHKKKQVLEVYINSPGGLLDACFSMLNAMESSPHTFRTIGTGSISSCGLVLFMAGDERHIYHNCLSMSHQFSWGTSGKQHELEASGQAFKLTAKIMEDHYLKHSKLSREKIRSTLLKESDVYLTAKQMKRFGLADLIIT